MRSHRFGTIALSGVASHDEFPVMKMGTVKNIPVLAVLTKSAIAWNRGLKFRLLWFRK